MRLLALPFAPRELEDYAKLLSKLPSDEYTEKLALIEPQNKKSSRMKEYLLEKSGRSNAG